MNQDAQQSQSPLLQVDDLTLDIPTPQGLAHILRGVSLDVDRGRTLGIVGESGSGKSMTLRCVLGLTPSGARVGGRMAYAGEDLETMDPKAKRQLIGRRVGVVFQNPMTSLNPVVPIARQMGEAARMHLGLSKKQARALCQDLLGQVGIPDPGARLDDYPHQFSGGMRQRVMIAMALTCEPDLLVADEATTALDVTIQKEILDLLQRLQAERGMAMVLVSHNLGVVAGRTDEVLVMYGGRVVERAPTDRIFRHHEHPYTEALLRAIPRLDTPARTRLPTLAGPPPSVYDPIVPAEEADRRDRARWAAAQESEEMSA
ncbi:MULTISPECIES: ABC transporter ATP-binding protein [unclassified Modestobacter]